MSNLSKADINRLLWQRGDLTHILRPWQAKLKEDIWKQLELIYVACVARQSGKSYTAAGISCETCIKIPRAQVKYAAQTKDAVRKIVIPNMETVLATCPEDLRPTFYKHEGLYRFKNGSEIHIAGAESGAAERLRGAYCDLFIVDEAGFIDENNNGEALDNLVMDVAMPMFRTRMHNRPRLLMISTPAKSAAHVFNSGYCVAAQLEGRYTHLDIYGSGASQDVIDTLMKAAGGEESSTWKREYLAQVVVDENVAVIPEFAHKQSAVVGDIKPPSHFKPFTAADFGYSDLTAFVFGYYHFPTGKIVVQDELVFRAANSSHIAREVKAKERELWGEKTPDFRVADHSSMGISDLGRDFGLYFRKPRKDDKEAAINQLRLAIQQERILISPKCSNAIMHLRGAVWNSSRTDFARSGKLGHFDFVDALIYFVRHIDRVDNPQPLMGGVSIDSYHIERIPEREGSSSSELKKLFRRSWRR